MRSVAPGGRALPYDFARTGTSARTDHTPASPEGQSSAMRGCIRCAYAAGATKRTLGSPLHIAPFSPTFRGFASLFRLTSRLLGRLPGLWPCGGWRRGLRHARARPDQGEGSGTDGTDGTQGTRKNGNAKRRRQRGPVPADRLRTACEGRRRRASSRCGRRDRSSRHSSRGPRRPSPRTARRNRRA